MIDYFAATLELKTVSLPQRLISGYAAHHQSIDRVRDIIDPAASQKAVRRLKSPSEVVALVGHDGAQLPIGIPQRIEATPQGLYTETYILKGPAGDNLLAVAKDLMDHGLSLGMSIGYKTHDSAMEQTAHGRVRRLLDYALKEYSFASAQAIANPQALVHSVKARRTDKGPQPLSLSLSWEGKMQYRVEQQAQDGRWLVYADADGDGDRDDNRLVGTYDSAEMANAVALALSGAQGDDGDAAGALDGDESVGADERQAADNEKTADGAPVAEVKATWDVAYVNTLPNSAFLYLEDGQDDDEGKRTPRSKRHFPYKDAEGKIDLPHLRNAIARIPQSSLPDDVKARVQARARRILAQAGDGKTYDEPPEWQSGTPLALYGLGCRLQDLSEQVAEELKAMTLLGEETKGYQRIPPRTRDALAAVAKEVGRLLDHAATIDRGEDGRQRLAWLKQQLALTEV